jgi:hypoxanthine phosphoribosyltransferase
MTATSKQPALDYIGYDRFLSDVQAVALAVEQSGWKPDFIVGIGRGGLVPAAYLSHRMSIPMLSVDHSSRVFGFADELLMKLAVQCAGGQRILFVDDINDSGSTIDYLRRTVISHGGNPANVKFAVLINNCRSVAEVDFWSQMINREVDKAWFVFPWEAVASSSTLVEEALEVPERLG